MKIIFATGNENKLREIREILGDLAEEVVSMKEAGVFVDPDETGKTFEENAILKAKACAEAAAASGRFAEGTLVMADDSGLEIDALGGEPGIYSARYLGHDTSYDEKNRKILERLKDVPEKERTARFVCAVAAVILHKPEDQVLVTRATMEGQIAYGIAGANGFGYDPIFYLPEYGKTSAEISPEEKNAISHRGKALRAMREQLLLIPEAPQQLS